MTELTELADSGFADRICGFDIRSGFKTRRPVSYVEVALETALFVTAPSDRPGFFDNRLPAGKE
jgi:hypothetical protein